MEIQVSRNTEYLPENQWLERLQKEYTVQELPSSVGQSVRCNTKAHAGDTETSVSVTLRQDKDGHKYLTVKDFRNSKELLTLKTTKNAVCKPAKRQKKAKTVAKSARAHPTETSQALEEECDEIPLDQPKEEERHLNVGRKIGWMPPASSEHPYLQRKHVPALADIVEHDGVLYVPLYDMSGKLVSAQTIDGSGSKRNLQGANLPSNEGFYVIEGIDEIESSMVLVAEGLATGESVALSKHAPAVVSFGVDRLAGAANFAHRLYPDRKIVLCADNDVAPTNNSEETDNTGLVAAEELALAHGYYLAVPPAINGHKTDFNDLCLAEGPQKVCGILDAAIAKGTCRTADGFLILPDGLYERNQEGGPGPRLGGPLKVRAKVKEQEKSDWSTLLEWQDEDGCVQQSLVQWKLLMSDPKSALEELACSYKTNWSKSSGKIREYIEKTQVSTRRMLATASGWSKDFTFFVMPDRVIPSSANAPLISKKLREGKPTVGGTPEGCREVAKLAEGNPYLTFAATISFGARFVSLLELESGGFHFFGESSKGKTTLLQFALSMGAHPEPQQSWNATSNSSEFAAARCNDGVLALDEIGVAKRDLGSFVYGASQNHSKGRLVATKNKGVEQAASRTWHVLQISTGEMDLLTKISKEGGDPQGGQAVRMADIPLPGDHIRDRHGYETDRKFIEALKRGYEEHHGWLIVEFLEHLIAVMPELRLQLPQVVERYVDILCDPYRKEADVDSQVERVTERFAICLVAGCLASAWGILPISQDNILASVKEVYRQWIINRGGTGKFEEQKIITKLTSFVYQNLARFEINETLDMGTSSKTPQRLAGYIQFNKNPGFYFNDTLESEVFSGMNFKYVKNVLKKHHLLITPSSKKENRDKTKLYIHKINGQEISDGSSTKKPSMNLYRIFIPDFFEDTDAAMRKVAESKTANLEFNDIDLSA